MPDPQSGTSRVGGRRRIEADASHARPSAPERIYETVLYGADVATLARFYAEVIGLRVVEPPDELAAALRLGDGGILLLFSPALAGQPGRRVPSHGATGPGHVAFTVAAGSLTRWQRWLHHLGIVLEADMEWDASGLRSLYLRDPAGNSVELVDGVGELWPP